MDISKASLRRFAQDLGLDDIRFAGAQDFEKAIPGGIVSPSALVQDARCIVVLFKAYLPAGSAPQGRMTLSSYYVASHAAYTAAKKLESHLREQGADAVQTSDLPSRAAALRTGGMIGGNHFYFHPQFGSFVCIKTVVTNAVEPDTPSDEQPQVCMHCDTCKRGCPSNAVDNLQNCLRNHIFDLIQEHIRGDVYQLIGCEKCQSACPLNPAEKSSPHAYPLGELLCGQHLSELKDLAGANIIRKNRVLSQASLYAANTGAAHLADLLEQIAQTSPPPTDAHARWALGRLKERM